MPGPISEDRPLTPHEYALARWMLEHGDAPDAAAFLPQLDRARVTSRCGCGCASVFFTIFGEPAPSGGMRLLGDFIYGDDQHPFGIFIFHCNGVLGGIELTSYSGAEIPGLLQDPADLRLLPIGLQGYSPGPSPALETLPTGSLISGSGFFQAAVLSHHSSPTTGNTPTTPALSTRSRSTP